MRFLRFTGQTKWDEMSHKTTGNEIQIFDIWNGITDQKNNWHKHLARESMCWIVWQVLMYKLIGCKCWLPTKTGGQIRIILMWPEKALATTLTHDDSSPAYSVSSFCDSVYCIRQAYGSNIMVDTVNYHILIDLGSFKIKKEFILNMSLCSKVHICIDYSPTRSNEN